MKAIVLLIVAFAASILGTGFFADRLPFKAMRSASPSDVTLAGLLSADTQPKTHVRSFIVGNSLVNHEAGRGSDLTSVPYWLARLARADGNTYAMAGTYAFLRDFKAMGPASNWSFNGVTSAWNSDSPVSFADADFTSLQINPLNYVQWRGPTEPYWDDNGTPVGAALEVIDFVTSAEPGIEVLIYEGWADMGSFINGEFPPSPRELAKYHAYNLGEYHEWYLEYVRELKAARPDIDIRLIPVSSALSTLLTQSPLDQLSPTDLYEDDAPHGTPTKYFLASLVTYVGTYGKLPPEDFAVPPSVHPLVRSNYAKIIAALGG